MIRTLVVEDDPRIAEAHTAYLGRVPGFVPVSMVHSGTEAERFLDRHPVDVLLLDIYLPDMTGLDVCRRLRARGHAVDIIAVTSARDVAVVRAAVALGVVQYLIKPFTFATFRDKLERYAEYRRTLLAAGPTTAQQDVDRALSALRGATGGPLPKGLSNDTLSAVVDQLRRTPAARSAAAIGEALGIARGTARRYLEHLADQGLAHREPRYGHTGRPEHVYTWAARGRPE
jgi:response regulator of citrate/malate metabolism